MLKAARAFMGVLRGRRRGAAQIHPADHAAAADPVVAAVPTVPAVPAAGVAAAGVDAAGDDAAVDDAAAVPPAVALTPSDDSSGHGATSEALIPLESEPTTLERLEGYVINSEDNTHGTKLVHIIYSLLTRERSPDAYSQIRFLQAGYFADYAIPADYINPEDMLNSGFYIPYLKENIFSILVKIFIENPNGEELQTTILNIVENLIIEGFSINCSSEYSQQEIEPLSILQSALASATYTPNDGDRVRKLEDLLENRKKYIRRKDYIDFFRQNPETKETSLHRAARKNTKLVTKFKTLTDYGGPINIFLENPQDHTKCHELEVFLLLFSRNHEDKTFLDIARENPHLSNSFEFEELKRDLTNIRKVYIEHLLKDRNNLFGSLIDIQYDFGKARQDRELLSLQVIFYAIDHNDSSLLSPESDTNLFRSGYHTHVEAFKDTLRKNKLEILEESMHQDRSTFVAHLVKQIRKNKEDRDSLESQESKGGRRENRGNEEEIQILKEALKFAIAHEKTKEKTKEKIYYGHYTLLIASTLRQVGETEFVKTFIKEDGSFVDHMLNLAVTSEIEAIRDIVGEGKEHLYKVKVRQVRQVFTEKRPSSIPSSSSAANASRQLTQETKVETLYL